MLTKHKSRWLCLALSISIAIIGFVLLLARQGSAQSTYEVYHTIFYKGFSDIDSTLYIQNPASSQITVEITFMNADYVAAVISRTIPAWGGLKLHADDLDELSSDELYQISLGSDQPVQSVVQSIIGSGNGDSLTLHRGVSQRESHQYFGPFYNDWMTSLSVVDVWNVSNQQATVTMTVRGSDGSQVDEISETVSSGWTWRYASFENHQLPDGFEGWVEAYSEPSVIASHVNRAPGRPDLLQAALEDQAPYAMPRVLKEVDEGVGVQTTKVFVANTAATTNTITGTYHTADGNVIESISLILPSNGYAWVDPRDAATLPTTGTWAFMFTSTHPIALGEQTDYTDVILRPSESYESAVGLSIALPHLVNTFSEYTIFSVQNTANTTATTEIVYHDLAGNTILTKSISLSPKGWVRYDLRNIPQLGNFTGNAIVTANQPLRAWVDKYLPAVPDLLVEKDIAFGSAALPGRTMEYHLRVDNIGYDRASNVLLTDTLPAGLSYVSWRGVYLEPHSLFGEIVTETVNGQDIVWPIEDIAAGDSASIYLTVRVTDTFSGGEIITNTAIITSDVDGNPDNNLVESSIEVETPQRDLELYKDLYSVEAAPPGGTMRYRLDIDTHNSNITTTNVILTDTLPTGLNYVSWSSSSSNHRLFGKLVTEIVNGQEIVWPLGDVPANDRDVIYLTVRVSDTLNAGDVVTNTAVITTSDDDVDPADNQALRATTIAEPRHDLWIDKRLNSGIALADTDITYRIGYRNNGNMPAPNLRITDTLPGNVTYVGYTGEGVTLVQTGTTLIWERDVLSVSQGGQIYLTVRITDTASPGDWLTNTVRVGIPYTETDETNNENIDARQVLTPTRDMQVSKSESSASGDPLAGETIQYQLYFRNDGNSTASNVVITDTLPDNLTFVSWSDQPYWINHMILGREVVAQQMGNQIIWPVGEVEAGQSDTIYLQTQVVESASPNDWITNTLTIAAGDTETDYDDNESLHGMQVLTPTRDVQISKSLGSAPGAPGGRMTYNILYRNDGNIDAHDVVITDTLPAGVTYFSDNAESAGFTTVQTGDTLVWRRDSLYAASYNSSFDLVVRLPDGATIGDWFTNTVEISTSDEETDETNNDFEFGMQVVSPTRDMRVSKSWYSGSPLADAQVTYQLYFENEGNMPAPNVVITDTLPDDVTYLSWRSSAGDNTLLGRPVTVQRKGNQLIWSLGEVEDAQSDIIYVVVHIADDVQVGTTLTNTAEIATSHTDIDPTDNESVHARKIVNPTQDVRVTKTLNTLVAPGNTFEYIIQFYNQGNSAAHDVIITDTLPMSLTYLSWTGELWDEYFSDYGDDLEDLVVPTFHSDGRIVWHLKELGGGDNGTIYLTVQLTDTAPVGGMLVNTVAITCAEPDIDPNDNEFTLQTTISDFTRDMGSEKDLSYSSPPPVPGKYIEYRIEFENKGTTTAHDVVITDTLPITVEYDSWYGSLYNPDYTSLSDLISPTLSGDRRTLVWTLPSLKSGGRGYLYVRVHVQDDAEVDTNLVNEVEVSTSDVDINTTDNHDSATHTVEAPKINMHIEKYLSYGTPGTPDGWMAYQIYFRNNSNVGADNVVISDTLPSGVSLVSWDGYLYTPSYVNLPEVVSLVQDGQILTWNLGDLAYDAYGYIYLWVRIADTYQVGDKLENVVRVSSDGEEDSPENNVYTLTATLEDKEWNLSVYKGNDGESAAPGGKMSYYINYNTNYSNWPATDVVITDTLPSNASLVSWHGSGYHPDHVDLDEVITPTQTADGELAWNLGTLTPNSHGYLYLTIQLDAGVEVWNRIHNRLEGTSAEGAWDTSSEKDRVVLPKQDLYISKYLESMAGTPGGQMTYRLYFSNEGNTPVANVGVVDVLPAGTSLASWRGYVNAPDYIDLDETITPTHGMDGSVTWEIGDLPAGGAGQIYATVNISATLLVGDRITNGVEINGDGDDHDPDNNRDHLVTILASAQADLSIDKTIHTPSKLRVPTTADYARDAARYAPLRDLALDEEAVPDDPDLAPDNVAMSRADQPEEAVRSEDLAFRQRRALMGEAQTGEIYLLRSEESLAGVVPGQKIQYRLYFENKGNVPVANVTVSDTLPMYTDFESWYGYLYTPDYQNLVGVVTPTISGNQMIWNIGTLGIGDYGYIYPTVRVTDTVSEGTDIVNRADIGGDVTEDDTTDNTATVSTTVEGLVSLTDVTITGETTPTVGLAYTYNADITPDDASAPTYSWSPAPDAGQGTASAIYSWDTTGPQSISVVVSNPGGIVSDTLDVTVVNVAPTGVTIVGPSTGSVNESYTFNTSVTPSNAADVSYTWTPAPHSGQGTASATYIWPTTGLKTISVEARNDAGAATDDHDIDIQPQAPDTVQVTGPTTGTVQQRLVFTATFEPGSVVLPLTYRWEATEQQAVTYETSDLVTTMPFTWTVAGPKTITVTVGQTETIDVDTWRLTIFDIPAPDHFDIYLPVVVKNP